MIRMPLAAVLIGAAAMALAGCTASTSHPDATSRAATSAPTPTVDAYDDGQHIDLLPIADGSVAATGDIGTSGPIRGSLTVVKEGDDYRLDLRGIEAPVDVDLAVTAQAAATSPGCFDRWRLSFGEPTTWSGADDVPSRSVHLHIGLLLNADSRHPDLVDPTFLDTVVVTRAEKSGTCVLTTLGTASLQWVQPSLRPDLRASDAGPLASAEGSVSADGTLYTVKSGDTLGSIARRFDLSAEDLRYLNPISGLDVGDTTIYPGQVLNLSPTGRGHPSLSHD